MTFDFKLMLSAVPTQRTYEVVVAVVIVVVTAIALFFLFRNVMGEIRKGIEDRKLVRKNPNEPEGSETRLVVERRASGKHSGDLLGQINDQIYHAKEGALGVLFYMNLDNFHYISDKYSAKECDRVILEIDKRLKKNAKSGSVIGHLKNDVFLYYVMGAIDSVFIREEAEALLSLVNEPLRAVNEQITTSIGIVIFPYDGISASHLIKNAEIALYVSKKEGKNRYYLYSQDLIEKEQFNIGYYQEIKRSISNDEFLLYYQPIIDIKTGKIIGLESLLRWNHPVMGILPPGKFLNVMDLTGDITWFGTWGFERIVKQYVEWKKLYRIRDLFISTNLSPKQLMVESLAKSFFDIVKKYEFNAESFCLEINDYYTIVKNPIAMANLAEFRKYGFRIAIDDLGDQFEIIKDMESIKASIIKISREDTLKVMNGFEETEKIIRSIQMAIQKQKVVIAEGIENEEMIKKMVSLDIRFMQGYYFSVPKSIVEIGELLQNPPWDMDTFDRFYQ
ncbi:MAG: GGDEF and EAL domain-containing protein [Candidatus Izemoplasmatales bacterium]|nr:GGDEF and EAL domain-containing protein [Candidatus Izemoplasmatales bacterium]